MKMDETAKMMCREIFDNCSFLGCLPDYIQELKKIDFVVANKEQWENEDLRLDVLRRTEYFGINFTYKDGKITFVEMDEKTYNKKDQLKNAAYRYYYMLKNVKVENEKMDRVISQLEGFKEIKVDFPYETKSSDVVIFMFPKDNPEKDWADIEYCDVLVYDRNYQEYFKVKTMSQGFTEIFATEVSCRTALADGGYYVRLRETALLSPNDSIFYVFKDDVTLDIPYSKDDMEQALNDVYGKSFKEFI